MTFVNRSILNVKTVIALAWLSQMDSATAEYYRMCQSSSSSMFVEKYNPGCLKNHKDRRPNEQLDDFYLRKLKEVTGSDTTDPQAHLQMHKYFGVNSVFRQDGNRETLEWYIAHGHILMTGQLHHDYYTTPNPQKSHWTVCNGWTPENDSFVFHDPAGTMDVTNGGYNNNEGAYRKYPWEKWKRRWMADMAGNFKEGSGWLFAPVVDKATGKYVPLKKAS